MSAVVSVLELVMTVIWVGAMVGLVVILVVLARLAWLSWSSAQLRLKLARPVAPAQVNPLWRTLSGETVFELRARVRRSAAPAAVRRPDAEMSDAAWRRHAGSCAVCFEALWGDGEPCSVGHDLARR